MLLAAPVYFICPFPSSSQSLFKSSKSAARANFFREAGLYVGTEGTEVALTKLWPRGSGSSDYLQLLVAVGTCGPPMYANCCNHCRNRSSGLARLAEEGCSFSVTETEEMVANGPNSRTLWSRRTFVHML